MHVKETVNNNILPQEAAEGTGRARRQMKWSWRPEAVTAFWVTLLSPPPFSEGSLSSLSGRVGPGDARACHLRIWDRLGQFPQC